MFSSIKTFFNGREWLLIAFLALLFIVIRIPGLDSPLHQDEYKWPMSVNPYLDADVFIPHPPLGELIYKTAGYLVGFDIHFRFVPLFFGTLNLLLLYYLLNRFFGKKEAIVGSFIWIFSYFSVLASLMVDTDGQIMPFFFLSALIFYYHLKEKFTWYFGILLALSLLLGFMVKLSFILAIGAIIIDFLWDKKNIFTKREYLIYGGYLLLSIIGFAGLIFISKVIFPFFDFDKSLKYWEHFIVFDRGWMQTAIQFIKAILLSSPLLILLPLFNLKTVFQKARVFVFFILVAFIFYVVLFDFSIGALDRYLQLLILPLTVISSMLLTPILFSKERRFKEFLFLGLIVALVLFLLQSIPHFVPPLHPKSEWISRALSFRWNFLYPFSGGSGPLGFYVSFMFIALSWIITAVSLVIARIKPNLKKLLIIFILPISLIYNLVFISEYLFGFQNGSAPKLLSQAVSYIENNSNIEMVTVYNDNGGNEIQEIGKYRKRLYIDPKFDVNDKIINLNKYKEHYFVLDVPRIDPTSIYQKYFDSCEIIYKEYDKSISATIYDCVDAPDISF